MRQKNGKLPVLKWIVNIAALTPGLAVIKKQITLPPGFSHLLLGGFIEAFGAFVVLYCLVNKNQIKRLPQKRLNTLAVVSIFLFLFCFFAYEGLMAACVINSNNWGKDVFIPLWISGKDAAHQIQSYGGLQQFYDEAGVDGINSYLHVNSKFSLFVTEVIFYVNFFLLFTSLISAFVILWIKYEFFAPGRKKA
jgi:hypothetical protein